MRSAILSLFLLFSCGLATEMSGQNQDSVVGTWQLVSYEDRRGEEPITFPWGKHPVGVLIYDDTGHMAVQIQRTPIDKDLLKPEGNLSRDDKLRLLTAYTAYFGTYSLDTAKHTITHHVEGNLFPIYIGSDQIKRYKLNNDQLILGAEWTVDGKLWTGTRVFTRLVNK